MDAAQKKRILTRYLIEKSEHPALITLQDQTLIAYSALDRLLDFLDSHNDGFFNFDTIIEDQKRWSELADILNDATTFTSGSPPILTNVNERKAGERLQARKDLQQINSLPQHNYYHRPTSIPVEVDCDLNNYIEGSRTKLYALTQDFPGATAFDPKNQEQISQRIAHLEKLIKSLNDNDPQKTLFKNHLNIFMDLNKIHQLKRISIPQEQGPAKIYCSLAESAGGVTEKLSFISLETVKRNLSQLNNQNKLNISTYNLERDRYKLSTEAIIKLPKHGKVQEVQREAMALNISRLMGLDTASCLSISYDGRPALFVPFDNIRLLQEFTQGKVFKAGLGISGQTYTHYSTIKPVGEGLQADSFLDDFGNSLGLFYLCSDTDAIGGYCQNKALRNARSLYIFDLMIMDDNNFKLDTRLSLQPDHYLMKHSRHGQGRNRTLIEDSSMVSKYASIKKVQQISNKIVLYVNYIAEQHHQYSDLIRKKLGNETNPQIQTKLQAELYDIELLEKDAELIKNKMLDRIAKIDTMLPKTTGNIKNTDVLQSLILEKLLHNPVLYSDDGRPYKNPWTSRQTNNVLAIHEVANKVQIHFEAKISQDMVGFIKRRGGCDSLLITAPLVITISKDHLNSLHEYMLHPENDINLVPTTDYLVSADLDLIKEAYGRGHRNSILNVINGYRKEINKNIPIPEKIIVMNNTEAKIRDYILNAKDKGLGMHVLKKLQFDAQQQLQKLMHPKHMPANLNQAFSAALKLDRVSQFNSVVKEALLQNKLTAPKFITFLNLCIEYAEAATNHIEGRIKSLAMADEAQKAKNDLQSASVPLIKQLGGPQVENIEDFVMIPADSSILLGEELLMNQGLLMVREAPPSPLSISSEESRTEGMSNEY